MPFPITSVLDNFNRANEGPQPSASWVASTGTGLKVVNNVCVPDVTTLDQSSTWNTQFPADQEVFLTIAAVPADGTNLGMVLRLQTATNSASDHYEVNALGVAGANNDVLTVYRRLSGVNTQLGTDIALGVDFAIGNTFGMRINGTELRVYFNGAEVATRTDSEIPGSGYIAAGIEANSGAQLDDFGGGEAETYRAGVAASQLHASGGMVGRQYK